MNFQLHSASRSSYPSTISQESALSDIFSWSTSVETKIPAPTSSVQAIPLDIRASLDFDNISCIVPSPIATILDPSSQDIEFDRSCLEGLDAQLVHFPTNAFAAMCWLGATGTIPTHLTSDPATRNTKVTHEEISSGSSSDESESESDESHTPDDHVATVFVPKESDAAFGIRPMMIKDLIIQLPFDERVVSLGPHFTKSDPRDSIGYFPVPSPRRKMKSAGIASFLPSRFMKSSLVI